METRRRMPNEIVRGAMLSVFNLIGRIPFWMRISFLSPFLLLLILFNLLIAVAYNFGIGLLTVFAAILNSLLNVICFDMPSADRCFFSAYNELFNRNKESSQC